MAQQPRQAMTVAPRYSKPTIFGGTDASWRTLCDLYPSAETSEVIMAVVEYCAARRLDPFKKPCHIVPMYNSKLRRKVQVVMQGINEVEITASRTGAWAGMDAPIWGPEIERTFEGVADNDDGSKRDVRVTVKYYDWCSVTVYRLVAGEKQPFTEQVFFDECYARAGFKTVVPNERWAKAPKQMLHKCAKAATLRAAFPEEGLGYTAEEMEDRTIDTGGVTIDGVVDAGEPGFTEADRRPPPTRPRAAPEAAPPRSADDNSLALLNETNGPIWLRNLGALLAAATSVGEVVAIAGHRSINTVLETAPPHVKEQINGMLREAHERVRPAVDEEPEPPPADDEGPEPPPEDDDGPKPPAEDEWPAEPADEMIAEVEAMSLSDLETLPHNMAWKVKVKDLIPPQYERLQDAITARRESLKEMRA